MYIVTTHRTFPTRMEAELAAGEILWDHWQEISVKGFRERWRRMKDISEHGGTITFPDGTVLEIFHEQ